VLIVTRISPHLSPFVALTGAQPTLACENMTFGAIAADYDEECH
jgi:hypothetical protein